MAVYFLMLSALYSFSSTPILSTSSSTISYAITSDIGLFSPDTMESNVFIITIGSTGLSTTDYLLDVF